MAHLAVADDRWVRAKDLAVAADVPFHYLAKLLGLLVRAHLLQANRGKHGGYRLARPAEEITVLEVINTIEPIVGPRQCLLWRRDCDCEGESICAVHEAWASVMTKVYEFLQGTTLAEIAESEGLEMPAILGLEGQLPST
ncbi:MAG: Rrf2 family transcriptional regulator [Armatimonadetes bacterium]|nr:Rrf2 family transcriptional regulator [Armatimonadota bacterium]